MSDLDKILKLHYAILRAMDSLGLTLEHLERGVEATRNRQVYSTGIIFNSQGDANRVEFGLFTDGPDGNDPSDLS